MLLSKKGTVGLLASARREPTTEASAMKKGAFTVVLLILTPAILSAQTQNRQRLSSEQSTPIESNATRSRIVGPRVANHAERPKTRAADNGNSIAKSEAQPSALVWGNTPIELRAEPAKSVSAKSNSPVMIAGNGSTPTFAPATAPAVDSSKLNASLPSSPSSRSSSPAAYNVGVGDVLDVRLPNTPAHDSTLYTVLKNGTIEYPLLNGPLMVAGMTTDQIARQLAAQIKVIKTPKVNVSIRDYASHAILINGSVDSPGRKILRREATPLYVLLAESSVRPEATTATIVHNGKESAPLSLKDEQAMATMIFAGDAIKISAGTVAPHPYDYVGGEVAAPGEKNLRTGMTLTQVLLSAGANLSTAKTARIARRNPSGLLATVEYDLRSIQQGKTPDPQIVPGDRIEVTH